MEDFLLVALVIGFIWVVIRQSQFSGQLRELEELYKRVLRAMPEAQQPPAVRTTTATQAPAPGVVSAPPPPPQTVLPEAPRPVATRVDAPAPVAPYVHRPTYVPPAPPAAEPRPAAAFVPPPPTPPAPKPSMSLEARLGQNWLNKLGITAMVVGIALGLGYQLHNLGPGGKSLVGLVIALTILGFGVFLERKPNYRIFARACIGGGWALLFFLSFAIYHLPLLRVLHSSLADLVLMLVVASGMVAHSLRYHSQTITTLAFFLALLTVGISDVTVFSLVAGALLTAALAVLVYRERWFLLGLFGLIGVYVTHAIWLYRVLPDGGMAYLQSHGKAFPEFVPSALLLLAYWMTFRVVYVFRAPLEGAGYREQQGIASCAALLNSVGLLSLLKYQSSHPEWAFAALLALGAVELVLAFVARRSVSGSDGSRNRPAFLVLSTLASVVLLAAIPFRFHGASWSLLWLLEAEAFFFVGIRLPEVVFRRIGVLASLGTAALLVIGASDILSADSGLPTLPVTPQHPVLVLVTAALVLWLNAELVTRVVRSLAESEFDVLTLRVSSYLGALLAALAITIALHPGSAWLAIGWLVLSLALGEVADRLDSGHLATQADLLAMAAVIHTAMTNLWLDAKTPYRLFGVQMSLQLITIGTTALLLYAAVRRRRGSFLLGAGWRASVYTWAAAALVTVLCAAQFSHLALAVAWGVFALILFELGMRLERSYLRQQGYAILGLSFVRIFFANLRWFEGDLPHPHGSMSPALYTVIPLIAAFAYVYERTQRSTTTGRLDKLAGSVAAWAGLIAAGSLLYTELRPDWILMGWALLALATLGLATVLTRPLFLAQTYAVLIAVMLRAVYVLFISTAAEGFYNSRPFTVGMTCALLFSGLTLAFRVRRSLPQWLTEQAFFFAPLLLLTLLIFVQLHGGRITMGWVALGLATFLFALTVKERSYRLAGLGVLLLGVAKILLWDIWQAAPAERWLTLVIMGAALLLISFLYSRYRETLLKLL